MKIEQFISYEQQASFILDDVFTVAACIPLVNGISGVIRGVYGFCEVAAGIALGVAHLAYKIFNFLRNLKGEEEIGNPDKAKFLKTLSKDLLCRGLWDIGKGSIEKMFLIGNIFAISSLCLGISKRNFFSDPKRKTGSV